MVALNTEAIPLFDAALEGLAEVKEAANRVKELALDIAKESGIKKLQDSTEALAEATEALFGKSHGELEDATRETRDFYKRIEDNLG